MNGLQFAQPAAAGQLHGELEVLHIAPLHAGLKHTAAGADMTLQVDAFHDGHGAWLLAVDILSGFRGQHRSQRVPAVPGGDEHGIDVAAAQHLEHIAAGMAVLVAVFLVGDPLYDFPLLGLRVGNGQKLDIRLFEKPVAQDHASSPPQTDPGHRDPVARGHVAVQAECARGNDGRHAESRGRRSSGLEELAAADALWMRFHDWCGKRLSGDAMVRGFLMYRSDLVST